MNYLMKIIVIASLFVLNVIKPVCAIKCFQCTSLNPGCAELTMNDTDSEYFKECADNYLGMEPFCRKTVQTIIDADMTRIHRECGWIIHKTRDPNCYINDDEFKLERSCQCFEDGCNKSSQTVSNYLLILIVSTFYYLSIKFIRL